MSVEAPLTELMQARAELLAGGDAEVRARAERAAAAVDELGPASLRGLNDSVRGLAERGPATVEAVRVDGPAPPEAERGEVLAELSTRLSAAPRGRAAPATGEESWRFAKNWPFWPAYAEAIAELRARGTSPPRQPSGPRPAWVEPWSDAHGGLIHGGIAHGRGFSVRCRAYRRFYEQRNGAAETIDAVAGVCEVVDGAGQLVERFSSATALHEDYRDCGQRFAPGVMHIDGDSGARRGFFVPAGARALVHDTLLAAMSRGEDLSRFTANLPAGKGAFAGLGRMALALTRLAATLEFADDGVPDPVLYLGRTLRAGRRQLSEPTSFREAPGPEAAVEHPLFSAAAEPSPGFVIDTPYLSLFCPGPGARSMVLAMVGAHRRARFHGARLASYERRASWTVRLIEAPRPSSAGAGA